MDLEVRTLRGSVQLKGLHESVSISELKKLLHEQHTEAPLAVPAPEHQRLVYKGRVLRDGTASLTDAGLASGDALVLLLPSQLPPPPESVSTPTPDAAALRAAMVDEARLRGLDPAGLAERLPPGRSRRGAGLALNLPADLLNMDPHVIQLLQQALDSGGLLGALGGGGLPGGEGEYDLEDVVPPEPPADAVAQLTDMGFEAPLVRKALLLSRHNIDLALEWLLQHGEEPGAADPPTQEQLRAVWGTRRRRRAGAAAAPAAGVAPAVAAAASGADPAAAAPAVAGDLQQAGAAAGSAAAPPPAAAAPAAPSAAARQAAPPAAVEPPPVSEAAMQQLAEMGFAADVSRRALQRFRGNVDYAVSYLLGGGGAGDEGAGPGEGGQQQQQAAPGGDEAMASPGSARVSGDQDMAEAGSPQRGGPGQQRQGDNEEEMVDAEEGFGMGSDEYEEGVDWLVEGDEDGEGEEEEFLDPEGGEAIQQLGNALGTLGSMDLAQLGSADMEQLLQGVDIDELVGSQLFPGAVEPGSLGTNAHDVLLRLMEAPGLLHQVLSGGGAAPPGLQPGQQQGQQQQQRVAGAGAAAREGGAPQAPAPQEQQQGGNGQDQASN